MRRAASALALAALAAVACSRSDPPKEKLSFLAGLPEFAELDLSITEPRLREVIAKHRLISESGEDGGVRWYHLSRRDGENVIVSFTAGKCSGIQRMQRVPPDL